MARRPHKEPSLDRLMPRNEEGEFELVLGNRQLLSGFFIVVILFGVFFTMGYIVGRHSSPPGAESAGGAAVVPRPSPADRSEPRKAPQARRCRPVSFKAVRPDTSSAVRREGES